MEKENIQKKEKTYSQDEITLNNYANSLGFETLIKGNAESNYKKKWYPKNINTYRDALNIDMQDLRCSCLKNNIACNMQYLEFLQKEMDELEVSSPLHRINHKGFFVTADAIIEGILQYFVYIYSPEKGTPTFIELIDILKDKKEKAHIPGLDEEYYTFLHWIRLYRNGSHILRPNNSDIPQLDYYTYTKRNVMLIRCAIHELLTLPSISSKPEQFDFLKPSNEDLKKYRKAKHKIWLEREAEKNGAQKRKYKANTENTKRTKPELDESLNDKANRLPFNTLLKGATSRSFAHKWYPISIERYRKAIFIKNPEDSQLKLLRNNLSYQLQYLEYLQKIHNELALSDPLLRIVNKDFCISGAATLEGLFICVSGKRRHKRLSWQTGNLRFSPEILGIDDSVYKTIYDIEKLRNSIHLFPKIDTDEGNSDTAEGHQENEIRKDDYTTFTDDKKELIQTILYQILTNPAVTNNPTLFQFLKPTENSYTQ